MQEFLKFIIDPSTIALLIGGLLTSLFGFIAGISKDKEPPKWIAWGSFFAGIIVLFAGIISGYQGQITSKALQDKTEIIVDVSRKNVQLAEINAALNKEIVSSVTGGDSYIEIIPFIPVEGNMIQFYLWNRGENPLYDVNIRILDKTMSELIDYKPVYKDESLDPLLRIKSFNIRFNKATINLNIGNISPNNLQIIGPYKISGSDLDKKEQIYLISISARNGSSSVDINAVKFNKSWKYSWRGVDVSDSSNKKILYEVIRDGVTLD